MTTDATRPWAPARWLTAGAAALGLWLGGLGLVTLLVEPAPVVVVLAPGDGALRAAAASGVDLLDGGPGRLAVRATRPGFVRDLYRNGAWLVWPLPGAGCGGAS